MEQIVCVGVSFYLTNRDDVTAVFVTLLICGLNLFLVSAIDSITTKSFIFIFAVVVMQVMDITILLFPTITYVIGQPARPEYIFAFLGLVILAATLDQESVTIQNIKDYLVLEL